MSDLWGDAVRAIEPKITPAHLDTWVRPIECVAVGDDVLHLRVPNRYHKEWFEDHYLPAILEVLAAQTQKSYRVILEVTGEGGLTSGQTTPVPLASSSSAIPGASAPPASGPRNLDSRYTFDRFVVGPTNSFAHAAARMVADAPASRYNPLFIYGGVGLGKTHLLHAIGYEIWRQHPDWTIASITCERFVSDFIGAIGRRNGGVNMMEDFRRRFREAPDVLLVDDIQFFSHKDSSQDEFFHTFNALHLAHKQIVLTSDKLPAELPGVEERLRSRFTWGLITEICQPDFETRVAIVKRKAETDNVTLPEDSALLIASQVKSNVRELEGALLRVTARAAIERRAITRDLVEETLQRFVTTAPSGLTIEAIQREVCSYFDVKLHDLKSPNRHRAIAHPRMIAMFLARRMTSMSYPEIGNRFGGKDHSTVISAVKKIERLYQQDSALRSVVGTIESHLRER
jgi:chromosomal replication initiator protein